MLQGFYMLAMQRARRQKRIALLACLAALVSAFFAASAYFTPDAVPVSATEAPYVAQSENGLLVVSHGGEVVIRTDIDIRTLPAADREALEQGILLSDTEALAKLLEDYGS